MTRRDFLTGSAGVVAALGKAARAFGAGPGMFVSLNSSLTGRKTPWPAFARLAASIGYGGVDVMLDGARKEGLEATRALFGELKIQPGIAGLPMAFSGTTRRFRRA